MKWITVTKEDRTLVLVNTEYIVMAWMAGDVCAIQIDNHGKQLHIIQSLSWLRKALEPTEAKP